MQAAEPGVANRTFCERENAHLICDFCCEVTDNGSPYQDELLVTDRLRKYTADSSWQEAWDFPRATHAPLLLHARVAIPPDGTGGGSPLGVLGDWGSWILWGQRISGATHSEDKQSMQCLETFKLSVHNGSHGGSSREHP